jgi:hypothetical protein
MSEQAYKSLAIELGEWRAIGKPVELWWRDDDVQSVTSQLQRLFEISRHYQIPMSLAAIPHGMDAGLQQAIEAQPWMHILQHG